MIRIKHFVLTAAAALALTACEQPGANYSTANRGNTANISNANANAAKPVAAAPTKEALMTLERSAYEAFKNKNAGFWDGFLSSNFVGFGQNGRLDRAAAIKEYSGADCDVKSYTISDESMMPLGADAAAITYKVAIDGTCGGQKMPANTWAAGVYVREGDSWKGAFHAETPVTDANSPTPKAAPASAATSPAGAPADAMATTLMAVETKAWDAWKQRDAKAVEAIMAKDFTYLSGTGPQNKAASIKLWSEPKCEGLTYTHSEPKSVSLSKDVALVTYKADVKGTCDGKAIPPSVLAASFSVKEGDNWKNAFYTDVNR